MKRGTRYAGRWSRLTLSRQSQKSSQKMGDEAEGEEEATSKDSGSSILTLNALMQQEKLEKDPFFALDNYHSQFLATIIEDIVQALNLLNEANSNLRIMKFYDDLPIHIAKKYGLPGESKAIPTNLKDADHCSLKLNKLERDRENLCHAMVETYKGLIFERGFRYLSNHINSIDEYKGRAYLLELDVINNKFLARGLRKRVRQQVNHYKTEEYDIDLVLERLRLQIQDAALTEEVRERLVDRWQMARAEQLEMKNKAEQDANISSAEYYKRRAEQEQIVNREIEMHISIVLNETLRKVDEIMKKYEYDLETIDLKIQILRNDHANMLDKRIEMENRLKKHSKEIVDWIHFKDERERQEQYERDMHAAAVTVQAWWRGMLVRKPWLPKFKMPSTRRKRTKR